MLGISVYPYKEDHEATKRYIDKAYQLGFKKLFTNLLSLEAGKEQDSVKEMAECLHYAKRKGFVTSVDVNPALFEKFGVTYNDLSFFDELGADSIRLDESFDGFKEASMTYDKSDLDLEVNISYDNFQLENILSYAAQGDKIIGCHNFYPQRFTGLSLRHFMKCTEKAKQKGFRTAAFVNSQIADHGPHRHTDGLCTVEMHRDLPLVTQVKHMYALGTVDDIIIANSFASDEELYQVGKLSKKRITFEVIPSEKNTQWENIELLEHRHFNRGDINDYMCRSTFAKLAFKHREIPARGDTGDLQPGDITIGNENFGQYKGELAIVKQTMPNDQGYKNVVAKIVAHELFLMEYVQPWTRFDFVKSGD